MEREINEQAAEWYARLNDGGVTPAMREEFARWVMLSPDHIRAFLEVTQMVNDIGPAAEGMSVEALVRSAREYNDRSNVVPLGGAEPSAVEKRERRSMSPCCVIAVVTIALLASFMAASWLTRDRWLCRVDTVAMSSGWS